MPNADLTGTLVTASGQSAEVVYCFHNATGASTDGAFTRTDTNATLTAKDGYIIRVLGVQLFGGESQQTLTLKAKPTTGSSVAIGPTITLPAAGILSVVFGNYGATSTKENETIVVDTSGACGIMLQVVVENVSASTTTTVVTPPTPPPTAAVDWDPSRFVFRDAGGTPASEGDGVYQWESVSRSYTAVQTITARRPTYRDAIFKGKPAIEFYLDDVLPVTTGSMQTLVSGTNTEVTIFLVVKFNNITSTQCVLGFANAAAANPTYRFGCYIGTNYVAWKTDDTGTADNFASGALDVSVPAVLTFVVDNSGSGLLSFFRRIAGSTATATDAATATNTTYNGGALTATNATFGAVNTNSTNSLFSDCYLGRCIIYASELTPEQRAAVENELIGLYL